jgi:hypothetical protein
VEAEAHACRRSESPHVARLPCGSESPRDEAALHVRIGGDTAGHERRTAKRSVLGGCGVDGKSALATSGRLSGSPKA